MKRTIFEGFVNGEKFNDITLYNERVNKLMKEGKFVSASSNTRVEEYENGKEKINKLLDAINSCSADNKTNISDISLLPFMRCSDPFYLNSLIAINPEYQEKTNEKIEDQLNECYDYISRIMLNNADVTKDELMRYLNKLNKVITNITNDRAKNTNCAKELDKQLDNLLHEYENKCAAINKKRTVLNQASEIIETLLDFYTDVKEDVLSTLHDIELENDVNCCCGENCSCGCTCGEDHACTGKCSCKQEEKPASLTEVKPQVEFNINDLIHEVFGDDYYPGRLGLI